MAFGIPEKCICLVSTSESTASSSNEYSDTAFFNKEAVVWGRIELRSTQGHECCQTRIHSFKNTHTFWSNCNRPPSTHAQNTPGCHMNRRDLILNTSVMGDRITSPITYNTFGGWMGCVRCHQLHGVNMDSFQSIPDCNEGPPDWLSRCPTRKIPDHYQTDSGRDIHLFIYHLIVHSFHQCC